MSLMEGGRSWEGGTSLPDSMYIMIHVAKKDTFFEFEQFFLSSTGGFFSSQYRQRNLEKEQGRPRTTRSFKPLWEKGGHGNKGDKGDKKRECMMRLPPSSVRVGRR